MKEGGWGIEDGAITPKFFEANVDYFSNYGGDVVAFLTKCKIVYAKRCFTKRDVITRLLNAVDINAAFEKYKLEREDVVKKLRESRSHDEYVRNIYT